MGARSELVRAARSYMAESWTWGLEKHGAGVCLQPQSEKEGRGEGPVALLFLIWCPPSWECACTL